MTGKRIKAEYYAQIKVLREEGTTFTKLLSG